MDNVDATLSKNFRITEKLKVDFRASMFNVMNHPVFSGPGTSLGNANFGIISSQANLNRQLDSRRKYCSITSPFTRASNSFLEDPKLEYALGLRWFCRLRGEPRMRRFGVLSLLLCG